MSFMILRRTTSLHPLRSMQCIRSIPPVSLSPIVSTARRHAAHQAEESYDAFNERYSTLSHYLVISITPIVAMDAYCQI